MAPTTWDQMRAQEKLATESEERLKAMSFHAQMIHLNGPTPNQTCGLCLYFVDRADFQEMTPGRYFKCLEWRRTLNNGQWGGAKSDWRKKWDACGRFAPRESAL